MNESRNVNISNMHGKDIGGSSSSENIDVNNSVIINNSNKSEENINIHSVNSDVNLSIVKEGEMGKNADREVENIYPVCQVNIYESEHPQVCEHDDESASKEKNSKNYQINFAALTKVIITPPKSKILAQVKCSRNNFIENKKISNFRISCTKILQWYFNSYKCLFLGAGPIHFFCKLLRQKCNI